MSKPRESMTAFITSDMLDHDSLHTFLRAERDDGLVQWRSMCWKILEHRWPTDLDGVHSFRLSSMPPDACR